jgi:hypothetical protein
MKLFSAEGWDLAEPRVRGIASISDATVVLGNGNAPPGYTNAGRAASHNPPPPPPGVPGQEADHDKLLQSDEEEARRQRAALSARLDQPAPAAPTIAKTTLGPTQTAMTSSTGPAAQTDRTVVGSGGQQQVKAQPLAPAATVTAQNVNAPMLQPAAQVTAAQAAAPVHAYSLGGPAVTDAHVAAVQRVGPVAAARIGQVAEAVAPTVQQTTIATSPQDELRARQLALTNTLEGGATGTGGPTAADAELQLATDKARRQQMGLAITRAHGGNVGLAQMEANQNISDLEGQAGLEAASLRAKEQQDAQTKLLSALEGARTQDIGLATSQAGLTSQANLTDAQLASQAGLANLDVRSKTALTQAQLTQEAQQAAAEREQKENLTEAANRQQTALANAAATNDATKTSYLTESAANEALANRLQQTNLANAGFTQETGLANAAATNARNTEVAREAIDVAKGNQGANLAAATTTAQLGSTEKLAGAELDLKAKMDNASRELQQLQVQAKLDSDRGIHNADLAQQIAIKQADLDTTTSQFNAAAANTANIAQGQITSGESKADLDAQAAANALQVQRELGLVGAQNDVNRTVLNADQGQQSTDQADRTANKGLAGEVIGAGGKALALFSDERKKRDITALLAGDRESDPLLEALDRVRPVSFRYKNPNEVGAEPGKKFGVLAQDLERTEAGASVVKDTPEGKMIDLPSAVGLCLAALADIRKRMGSQKGAR